MERRETTSAEGVARSGLRFAPALPVLAMALGLAAIACGDRPTNLVLITVDSLRPDRLGYEGQERPTSAALDRLAASGVRFPASYSQAGWTLPSVATVLTGRYPREHGATRINRALRPEVPTLAELLQEAGYETRGYVSHVLLRPSFGLDRGFALYDHSVLAGGHPHDVATAEPLTDLAVAGLAELREPFFLWVHYFDPHFAYLEHAEWRHFGSERLDRYDGEIAHTDRQIGRLLDAVDAHRGGSRTVVAFTADHGEEFGEHGGRFHYTLHEEVVRVPLVIRAPGLPPGSRRRTAEQIDLAPTLLRILGVAAPPGLPGRDLFEAETERPAVFFERDRPSQFHQRGVLLGPHKLIIVEEVEPPAGQEGLESARTRLVPGTFLYNLKEDPGELVDLFDPEEATSRRLLALVEAHFGRPGKSGEEVELDEALREDLRSLGYLQ